MGEDSSVSTDKVVVLRPGAPLRFPDPRRASRDGPLAIGGDLVVERILHAYEQGIFPWPYEDVLTWWSPDPRAVFTPTSLHVSRSLRRTLRRGQFGLTWNFAFEEVMRLCGEGRSEGTWITPAMRRAYVRLHELGHAHSLEVWSPERELVGGLYGVQRGGLFAAESMFHRATDMSKVAVVVAVRSLFAAGIELFDVQLRTEHLASLGVVQVPRSLYLEAVGVARSKTVALRGLTLLTGE